jgi:hypothetical protein
MIILRNLIVFNIEKQVLLNPLNPRLASLQGLTDAIFTYLNLEKYTLSLPVYPATGIIATPPPVAGFSLVGFNVQIPDSTTLYNLLDTYTRSASTIISPTSISGIFTALSIWLSTIVMQVNIGVPLVSPVGVGAITFPAMASLGITCWSVMTGLGIAGALDKGDDDSVLDKSMEILSDFIYIGLQANIIPPIPTTGVIGSAFTGLSFPTIWSILDLYDFPPTDTDISDILSLLGLSSLSDIFSLSYDENEEIATDECSVLYTDGAFISPTASCTTLTDAVITTAINHPSLTTDYVTTSNLYTQANAFAQEMQEAGITSATTLHTDLLGSAVIRTYDSSQTADTTVLPFTFMEIVVNRPIIKTGYEVEVVDIERQYLAKADK